MRAIITFLVALNTSLLAGVFDTVNLEDWSHEEVKIEVFNEVYRNYKSVKSEEDKAPFLALYAANGPWITPYYTSTAAGKYKFVFRDAYTILAQEKSLPEDLWWEAMESRSERKKLVTTLLKISDLEEGKKRVIMEIFNSSKDPPVIIPFSDEQQYGTFGKPSFKEIVAENKLPNVRPEKALPDPEEVEKLRTQGEHITEQESSKADNSNSFPWWFLGIVGLIVVPGLMLLKSKSK